MAIALADWNRAREAGVPAFAVGPVARPVLYLDRAEAEAAADELDGTYIVWQGCLGRQVLTAEAEAYAAAYPGLPEPGPEAETEAGL
jgi:hypothetical protein